MPLWMQLLIGGGILQAPADGEGSDLGGGAGGQDPGAGGGGGGESDEDEAAAAAKAKAEAGENRPTDKEAKLIKEVMQRKEKEQALKAEVAELKARFDGIDPDEVRQILADRKDQETKSLEEKGDYERLKQRMADEHKAEVTRLNATIAELQQQNTQSSATINDLTVGAQFSQSAYIKEDLIYTPAKLRTLYGDHFEIEDGKIVGYDKPRGAAARTKMVDSYGAALGFDAAMRKIVEADPDVDHMIRSKARQGAGSQPNPKQGGKAPHEQPKTAKDKIFAGLNALGSNQ